MEPGGTKLSLEQVLSYLINQTDGGTCTHAPYPKELRVYGPSFGGNGASKYTENHLFYCHISTLLLSLVIIKILQGRSSLASLFIILNNNIIAILY